MDSRSPISSNIVLKRFCRNFDTQHPNEKQNKHFVVVKPRFGLTLGDEESETGGGGVRMRRTRQCKNSGSLASQKHGGEQ